MSNFEDRNAFNRADWDSRAREIIAGLKRDGYPELDQMTIIAGALCTLLGDKSILVELGDLADRIAIAEKIIAQGTPHIWNG
jgi:hypothetical protein